MVDGTAPGRTKCVEELPLTVSTTMGQSQGTPTRGVTKKYALLAPHSGLFHPIAELQLALTLPLLTNAFPLSSVRTLKFVALPAAPVPSESQTPVTAMPGTARLEVIGFPAESNASCVVTGNPPAGVPGCGTGQQASKQQVARTHRPSRMAYTVFVILTVAPPLVAL